jgi:hypothetical protein
MRVNARFQLALLCLATAVYPVRVHGQAVFPVKRELDWSQPGNEIDSLKFSSDGNFIVLVNRVNWPDGEDAESVPATFFKGLEERKKENPRFADPIVRLIDLSGKTLCTVFYGWNPDVSRDNKSLVYSRQKNPITGLRVLAETQTGNDIQRFDCEKKQTQTIAVPESGYLDNPVFLDDDNSIVFTENEGVNGAYAGTVAFDRFDLGQNHKDIVLPRRSVPAVPCPRPGPGESTHDFIMCSQANNRTASFYQLVLQHDSTRKRLIALLGAPIPSLPDQWMASNYDVRLVSLEPEMKELFSFGRKGMGDMDDAKFQLASEQNALIFSDHWRVFSLDQTKFVPETGPRNTRRRSIYSPDLKFYLSAEPADDDPDHFVLYRTADGKRLVTFSKMARVNEAVWNHSSSGFAFVGLRLRAPGSAYREELIVYSIR